jgi:hypothetical protein
MGLLAACKMVNLTPEEEVEYGITPKETDTAGVDIPIASDPPTVDTELTETEVPVVTAFIDSKPISEIYTEANIPTSPFPAEKLLKLLDGLKAMDIATRKAAVLAMDAADDSWVIDDSINDALYKTDALNKYKLQLTAQLQLAEKQAVDSAEEVKTKQEDTTKDIRQQISELEQLLERVVTQSAQDVTTIEATIRSTREQIGKESRRIDTEIGRLQEISAQFQKTTGEQ